MAIDSDDSSIDGEKEREGGCYSNSACAEEAAELMDFSDLGLTEIR